MPRSTRASSTAPKDETPPEVGSVKAGGKAKYTGKVEQHVPFLAWVNADGGTSVGIVLKPGDVVTVAEDTTSAVLEPVKE